MVFNHLLIQLYESSVVIERVVAVDSTPPWRPLAREAGTTRLVETTRSKSGMCARDMDGYER